MKRYFVIIATSLILLSLGCQDTREDLKNTPSDNSFYKNVGKQIPFETGMRWMEFYRNQTSKAGWLNLISYSIPAAKIEAMLESVSDPVGVAFHYGIDGLGRTHIIAIPVDGSLRLWTSIPGRIYIDANTGNQISQSTANAWAQNYKNIHPNDVWFHFFGRTIFDEIVAIPYFNVMDIEPALNDLNLTPQLLLIIWSDGGGILGRTNYDDGIIYDASNACPPCAIE